MKIFGLILLAPITYLLFIEFLFIMKREKIKRDDKEYVKRIQYFVICLMLTVYGIIFIFWK